MAGELWQDERYFQILNLPCQIYPARVFLYLLLFYQHKSTNVMVRHAICLSCALDPCIEYAFHSFKSSNAFSCNLKAVRSTSQMILVLPS
jgi:hypothetical protein